MSVVEVKMLPPRVPNYVCLDVEDCGEEVKIPISNLTAEQADWLAKEFRKGLDEVAKRQRETV